MVSGQYANPNYQDRSTATIGNPEEISRKKDDLYFRQLAGGPVRARSPMTERQATSPAGGAEARSQDLDAVRRRMEQLRPYNILSHS